MFTRVLLAFDGRPAAMKAFNDLLKQPPDRRSELVLLAVIKPSSFAVDYAAQEVLESATAELERQMERLQRRAQFVGTSVTLSIRIGDPTQQIVRAGAECRADLIIVGRNRSLLRFPWSSIAKRVRSRARCRVLVVEAP